LLESNRFVQNSFKNRLKESHFEICIVDEKKPAAYGAYPISKSQHFSKKG
jgi:hypothetical protein